ncbi:MAG: DUF2235 domain-containing protein [Hyphomicrobiaceae bacterium]
MKRLLVFFDGTWNRPDDGNPVTNVVKLYRAALPQDASGVQQIAKYVVGIATEQPMSRWIFAKGAAGIGVAERIQDGYKFLVENYAAGDEIHIFGFSRGAFQARSLGGLITHCGILRAEHAAHIANAWAAYQGARTNGGEAKVLAMRELGTYPARIRCIGVWDTVGNLGIPLAPKIIDARELTFHDTTLSSLVDVGLHALAIDEPRGPFSPTLWTRKRGAALPNGQIIEQVWFPGCHANVGGGYPDTGLSDISLRWMAERATAATGIAFDHAALAQGSVPDALAEQVSPTSDGVFRVSGVLPYVRLIKQNKRGLSPWRRAIVGSWRSNLLAAGEEPVNESIHASATDRYGQRVRLRCGNTIGMIVYRPRNLRAALGLSRWRRRKHSLPQGM